MALFGLKKTKTEDKKEESLLTTGKTVKKGDAQDVASMKDLYAPSAEVKAKGKNVGKYINAGRLLIKPLVTEKATNLSAENKYVFVVKNSANKIEVAKAIESVYGVKPVSVNIINNEGKRVSRGRIRGQRKDWKKAIVTLAKGETITIYEGI